VLRRTAGEAVKNRDVTTGDVIPVDATANGVAPYRVEEVETTGAVMSVRAAEVTLGESAVVAADITPAVMLVETEDVEVVALAVAPVVDTANELAALPTDLMLKSYAVLAARPVTVAEVAVLAVCAHAVHAPGPAVKRYSIL
jgi:hypothetical protein